MKLEVVAVYDVQAAAYMRPFFVPSLGMAIRSFQDEVNRSSPENPLFAHPEDYSLWHLGSWDEETGKFDGLVDNKQISVGKMMKTVSMAEERRIESFKKGI